MKKRTYLIILLLVIINLGFIALIKYVDVSAIGPNESSIGLSYINNSIHTLTGVHMNLYKLTEILGLYPIILVFVYFIYGFVTLIKRKNILKVNKEIIGLGMLYILIALIYIFFEKVIINYRPILIDGVLEASYPSSHTLLAVVVCASSIIANRKLFNNKFISIINVITYIIMTLIVIGRLVSGVHWATDIIGGLLISITLLFTYKSLINWKNV